MPITVKFPEADFGRSLL